MTLLLSLLLCSCLAADGQGDDATPLPEGVIACLRPAQSQHRGFIASLAFSPDGKIVASGSYSGLCLWEPDQPGHG